MSKAPSLSLLKEKIRKLESENLILKDERNSYRDMGVEMFKVVANNDKSATLNSMWIRNRLVSIYHNYGMPFIQWKKDE